MRPHSPSRLALEALEDRWLPSLTVSFTDGDLFLYGQPQSNNVQITQQGSGQFQVMDGTNDLGNYPVQGDIFVRLGNSQVTVAVATTAAGAPGNILINPGYAPGDTVSVLGSGSAGQIDGNLIVNTTTGAGDAVNLGTDASFSSTGLTVDGDVNLLATSGSKTYEFYAPVVGGSVAAVLPSGTFDLGQFGSGATVGSMHISAPDTTATRSINLETGTLVQGGFQFTGGAADTNTLHLFGAINGNVAVTDGSTNSNFRLGTGGGGGSVGGNLSYADAGSSTDNFVLTTGSIVAGDVSLNVAGTGFYTDSGQIEGNLAVSSGTGDIHVTTNGLAVGGGVTIHAGTGNNSAVLDSGTGGPINFTSGNGDNSLHVGGFNYQPLNVAFGSGTNLFVYDTNAEVASAYLDFGAGSSGDTYNDGATTVTWPQTIVNFQ